MEVFLMFKLNEAQIGDILQHKVMPNDFWGKIIDWVTLGGGYSHTAIYVGNNVKAEAREKGLFGVKRITLDEVQQINVYRVKGGLNEVQKRKILNTVKKMYGTKYDYIGLLGTIRSSTGMLLNWKWLMQSRPIFNDELKYFCSEIASKIYISAIDLDIAPDYSCYLTTPNVLGRSKKIERIS
jgi:uncharacterized protein YycO